MNKQDKLKLKAIRTAVADYIRTEGCGCCSNRDEHKKQAAIIGKLLRVPQYSDKSGYNFGKFETKEKA